MIKFFTPWADPVQLSDCANVNGWDDTDFAEAEFDECSRLFGGCLLRQLISFSSF